MSKDEMGDRMKFFESFETGRKFLPTLPIYARIDGRGFSKFTKGLRRPYDSRMTSAMIETTKYLVQNTHAKIGVVQSDEISLVWHSPDHDKDIFFAGKVQKMVSVLASMAAAKFIQALRAEFVNDPSLGHEPGFERFEERLPHFDARVFQLPSRTEAANVVLWRAMDALKNSVSMAANHHFSHKLLHGKNQKDMLQMLADKGIDFESFPTAFKRGTFLRREVFEKTLGDDVLLKIPEAKRPTAPVLRSEVRELEVEYFATVKNRVGVVFDGETPRYE